MSLIDQTKLLSLPLDSRTRSVLSTTLLNLAASFGENLVMVAIYGGLARGEWDQKTSDVNVLVVARTLDFARLADVAPVVQAAQKKARIATWLLTEAELQESADVFGVKFADIRRHHVIIAGKDVLSDLEIDASHLRFVAEFELRNIALRLRRHFLFTHGQGRVEQAVLVDLFTSGLVPLRALAEILGHDVAVPTSGAIRVIGEALGIDVRPLERLRELHATGAKASSDELERLFGGFFDVVAAALQRLEHAAS